ncbi:MAG: cation diffusion facilitator family transporter [Bacteroidales bacterium]|nr:cation diffusion facilitator family transporter [Bacteroidales bacterium]
MINEGKTREQQIYNVTFIGFIVNMFLSVGKFLAGFFGNSGAMIADAIHSISDFITDVIVLIFVKISAKPKDDDHDYGHGKYETLATVIIGILLALVGIGIFITSLGKIINIMQGKPTAPPEIIALAAAFISIIIKEILYQYTRSVGKKVDASVVVANAWHHRSDAFSSIGTLIGIGGAYFLGESFVILDPIAAIIISLFIGKVAYDLFIPGIQELLERSLPQDVENEILSIICKDQLVSCPHNLKTRKIGANIAIEVHIRIPSETTVGEAHEKTVNIEQDLREKYGEKTQVIIHVEPLKDI